MSKNIFAKVITVLNLVFLFTLFGGKVGLADSYEFIVVRYHNDFYISAKHYTKKHPHGESLMCDASLDEHFDIYGARYLMDVLGTESFVLKREDGVKFDTIDRRLNKIAKYEAFLAHPPSLKCVPSVMEQRSREYRMLIYDLINFRDAKT